MGQIGSLWYSIGAKTADLEKGLANSKAKLKGLGTAFKDLTGIGFGTAGAMTAIASGIRFVISEAMEAEKADARLNQVLKSTQGISGMTRDALDSLATGLSKVTVNSEETIKNAESIMLTFTKVGKEVFPQAIEAAMDMSAAFGQDLQSSVVQLGKALNDPSGMAAMKRIGVSFSEAQIAMAKELFNTGQMAEYQKLILSELNTEVGGMAKAMGTTYAGQVAILKNNFGELGETVGRWLVPALSEAAQALNGLLTVHSYFEDMVRNAPGWMQKAGISYDEYAQRVLGAAVAAGELTKREKEYYDFLFGKTDISSAGWINHTNRELGIMSRESYEAHATVGLLATAWENYRNSLKDIPEITEQTTEQLQAFVEEQDKLSGNMMNIAGQMESINEDYKKSLEEIANDETLTAEERIAATKKVEEAKNLATQKIILGYAQQILAADGLTVEEAQALLQQGVQWGIYSQTAVDEMMKVINQAGGLAESINNIPTSKDITITTYHTDVYTSSGSQPIQGVVSGNIGYREEQQGRDLNGNGIIGAANGADFIVPAGYMNDSYPMRVQTGERVEVTPAGQAGSSNAELLAAIKSLNNNMSRLPLQLRDAILLAG